VEERILLWMIAFKIGYLRRRQPSGISSVKRMCIKINILGGGWPGPERTPFRLNQLPNSTARVPPCHCLTMREGI